MTGWIMVPYWWHATILELLWLGFGTLSAGLTSVNLYDSWRDLESLQLIRGDPSVHERHYKMIAVAAKGRTSSQFMRLAISLLIMFTGAYGCSQANPLGGRTTWTGLTVTACLVAIALITALRSYLDYRQRNLLYEMASRRSAVVAARLRAKHSNSTE